MKVNTGAKPTLKRETFTTDRMLEFFDTKELSMQIGQTKDKWCIALLKESVDNALDACEKVNKVPEIEVSVSDNSFSVSDNGAGLNKATIVKSLDYNKRVSDKNKYVSPTRGQLGNALKTIYAAPFVSDGNYGKVEIETKKTRYIIEVTLDRIAQKPKILLTNAVSEKTEGVKITVFYKESACLLGLTKNNNFYNKSLSALELLTAYSIFNPHATFTYGETIFEATNKTWTKWNPSDPTSAHWYTKEQLRDLIAAHIANNHNKPVREFISEFRGLSGTQKQKLITETTGLHGKLGELVIKGDIDDEKVQKLLLNMQEETQPVKPQQLGIIGKDHIVATMEKCYGVQPQTVNYKKVVGSDKNLPYVIEVALGIKSKEHEKEGRTIICGLNWSPTLGIPFIEFGWLLSSYRVDAHDPICVVMHIARPKFNFVDRGKGQARG